ncbi:MAG: phosphatidate cytidylyltransferase [Burkholderiaceae bacterium]|nr:phosphatidate cytidylyltransferase [Burkholderiaceae bacterium]
MLKQRVITAIVLLAVLLPALFAEAVWPFALFTLAMVAAAGWEWGRLNGLRDAGALVLAVLVLVLCIAAVESGWFVAPPAALWWVAMLLWVLGGAFSLRAGVAGWAGHPRLARQGIGAFALVLAWLAFADARAVGINFLLSVLCLVWMADIAAYFGGRRFGRRKLAPAISPGKSWEGVYSGMAGVLLLAIIWAFFIDRKLDVDSASLYALVFDRLGVIGAVLALVFLAAMSVVGDLVESLVKRSAGAKDSSRLLPGHGGVLDRIDALLPVVPLAVAVRQLALAA